MPLSIGFKTYGIAIRGNVGNRPEMKKNIHAVLFHVSSSKTNQWHDHCPDGEKSWCPYKQDKATGNKTYAPSAGIPLPIVLKHLKPLFADLSKDELLSKCLHGKTQNNNESFNGTVWNRLTKTTTLVLIPLS